MSVEQPKSSLTPYRGRLAPSPTGFLHLGHARTFWIAWQRARDAHGILVFRNEDLDAERADPEFARAMVEDLRWLGLDWEEGPDRGGPFGPYTQSERLTFYRTAFDQLRLGGWLFPCDCSRRDIRNALGAPHQGEEEPVYPGTCRDKEIGEELIKNHYQANWRFRVPSGQSISWTDLGCGPQSWLAGADFGDFIVWRRGGLPSYQLACVVDDALMRMSEVVRGADLLSSTARQWLLYTALGWVPPQFFHAPLVLDDEGKRLAKRHDALSLRRLREAGRTPGQLVDGVGGCLTAKDAKDAKDAKTKVVRKPGRNSV